MCECKKFVDFNDFDDYKNYGEIKGKDPDISAEISVNKCYMVGGADFDKYHTLLIDLKEEKKECGFLIFEIQYCPFCGEKLNDPSR